MFEEVDSTLKGIEWGKIGVAIVEGICSGMLDCDSVLADYLGDFGENWLIGIKDIFDINSPSKLIKDEVRKYLAHGIGMRFEEELPDIADTALKVFENVKISAPEIDFSEIKNPDLRLDIAETELPEIEFSVSEIPEIEVPDLKIKSVMPESRGLPMIENSAVQALENQKINSKFIQPSATSEITNNIYNYNTSTTNNNWNISENPQNIALNAQFVVGGEIVAEGVTNIIADNIDEHQGIKIQLRKRGLAR